MTQQKHAGEDRAFWMDPADLKVARSKDDPRFMGEPYDRSHPTYNPSADLPDNSPVIQGLVHVLEQFDFLGGVIEAEEGPDGPIVVDGRKRHRAALIVNERRAKKGKDPLTVRVFIGKDDALTAYLKTVGLNNNRSETDPISQAKEILHLQALAKEKGEKLTPKAIATLYGWESPDTVKNRLKLLQAAPEAQAGLAAGEYSPSDILRIVNLSPEKQVERLKTIPKKDPSKPKARRRQKGTDKGSANTGPRKPTNHQLTQILDEIEDKSPANYAIRLCMGLVSLKAAAPHIGLDSKSPVYKALVEKLAKKED